ESPENYPYSYLEGLANENGPDLLVINQKDFGLFQDINRLYNYQDSDLYKRTLKEVPYTSPLTIAPANNNMGIYGILFNYSPVVMYYRYDYLDSYDLLSFDYNYKQPASDWFESSDLFLRWIEKAAADGHNLFQWQDDPYYYLLAKTDFIDREENSLMNKEHFSKVYEVATYIQKHRYFLGSSVWDKAGNEALINGELEALYFPTWGEYWLNEQVPEQRGLWRAAPLPLGLQYLEGNLFLIRKDSLYAESLVEYVMEVVRGECRFYQGNTVNTSDYMGGQKTGQLYYDLVASIKPIEYSNLDSILAKQLSPVSKESIDNQYSYDTFLVALKNAIKAEAPYEYEVLLK
ncbi:MAG: hypothetical protein JW708_11500, partial [Vallitaleaceae bacterium]|nr:hypothetical protein [Vallitaleaceae bacterium]